MGKDSTSTTQNTYPQWLMEALQPLMQGSAARMAEFQSQGSNVLQGRPYNQGVKNLPAGGSRPERGPGAGVYRYNETVDPEVWAQIVAARRGGGNG